MVYQNAKSVVNTYVLARRLGHTYAHENVKHTPSTTVQDATQSSGYEKC